MNRTAHRAEVEFLGINELREPAIEIADHLMLALAAGGIGTWRVDNSSGLMTIDEQLARLIGIEHDEFNGTFEMLLSMVHAHDRELLVDVGVRLREDKMPFVVEYRIVRPDGSMCWLHGQGRAILDADGEVVGSIGCVVDATARKVVEADARLQLARLEYITAIDEAVLQARYQ